MNTADIEKDMKKDYTWDRPSWNFGTFKNAQGAGGGGFKDDFGFFNQDGSFKREPEDDYNQFSWEEKKAFALLDLKPDVSLKELKTRYKVRVKKYHPDVNGGDKEAEERFKIVSEAYTLLKNVILD
jgi:DnaJ-domain-containing protein 1